METMRGSTGRHGAEKGVAAGVEDKLLLLLLLLLMLLLLL
jgi:hypothetical protein